MRPAGSENYVGRMMKFDNTERSDSLEFESIKDRLEVGHSSFSIASENPVAGREMMNRLPTPSVETTST